MYGLEKPLRKKSDLKKSKKKIVKNQSEIAACEQKSLSRTRIFVQTLFSHSTLNSERKNFTPKNCPKSLLQFDFKNHENVNRSCTNTIQIL